MATMLFRGPAANLRALLCCGLIGTLVAAAMATSLLNAQGASLIGSVLTDGVERPLTNAEVILSDINRSVRSDGAGRFLITGVATGKHTVTVRMLGYESFTTDIMFAEAQKVEADFLLKALATKLKTVKVKAAVNPRYAIKLSAFEERRAGGIGKFLTSDLFEHEEGRPPSSFLQAHIAGLRIMQANGERLVASARGGGGKVTCPESVAGQGCFKKYPSACYVQIVLDGRIEYNGTPGQTMFNIDNLQATDIIGLEFYTTATTPLQYKGTSGGSCGTVIIWTKF